ncbi:hypothetical protein CROQUDRAFT_673869 [Cronartium quercuum f. sp. fusiforme G11]|uniref:Uncharacterized protein n=1 Tax=Cronartium quercuum f. sp. fusiforme G11 TaxID=708437 RepID=A0A9P6T7T2_9BASI|nr:hypothetical protein CROQUDRAFT_673869 [Cronartium quercuum f. sp. fusiforme G11]
MSVPRFSTLSNSRSKLKALAGSISTPEANLPSPPCSFASQKLSKSHNLTPTTDCDHQDESDSESVVSGGATASTGLRIPFRLRQNSSHSSLSLTSLMSGFRRRVKADKKKPKDDVKIQASVPKLHNWPQSATREHRLRSLSNPQSISEFVDPKIRSDHDVKIVTRQLIGGSGELEVVNEEDRKLSFGSLSFRFPAQRIGRRRSRTVTEPILERKDLQTPRPRFQSSSRIPWPCCSPPYFATTFNPNFGPPNPSLDSKTEITDPSSPTSSLESDQYLSRPDLFDHKDEDNDDRSSFCTVYTEPEPVEFCFPKWPTQG